ncbi:hypothetical protein LPJ63_004019 [Coemansia sp. RSA 2711]|nr:hypothetical protein LPJ63_004019 [Coemansia sp. RSA 2711]KAJ2324294.1 hypothetical protein IWW51_003341 [Coemansia sp. RSA 2702]
MLRPAASLVLTAPLSALHGRAATSAPTAFNYAVLMVQRLSQGGSFDSAHVFPGGIIDAEDHHAADVYGHCAIRETYEETGLLLTTPPPSRRPAAPVASFKDTCAALQVTPLQPRPLARWTTPRAQKRRFDTRFLALHIDQPHLLSQLGRERPQEREVARLDWIAPDQALGANTRSEMPLYPPQAYLLHWLSRYTRWQDLVHAVAALDPLAAAATVEPVLCRRSDGKVVALLPGDHTYPDPQISAFKADDAALFATSLAAQHRLEMVPAKAGGFNAVKLYAMAPNQPNL